MEKLNSLDDIFRLVVEKQSFMEQVRPKDISKDHMKLSEEVGELAESLLKLDGYKTNKENPAEVMDNAKAEIADIIIMAMVIGFKLGMGRLEIIEIAQQKIGEWEDKHIKPLRDNYE